MESNSRILLVDDEENLLQVLSLMLLEIGWPAATASCAEDALRMVKEERYQFAIIDNQLGTLSGIDLIDKIGMADPDLPCILMTGDLNVDATTRALKRGAAGFLRKPFRIEELLVSIQQARRERELRQKQRELTGLCAQK